MKVISEEPNQYEVLQSTRIKGRKPKLTSKLIEKISFEIENGCYQKIAAKKCGIGESTFYSWMEKAEDGAGGVFMEFMESVKKASAIAESRAIQTILSDDSWQSRAWYLERRFPERWGRKDRLEADKSLLPKVVFYSPHEMSEKEWNALHDKETKELD